MSVAVDGSGTPNVHYTGVTTISLTTFTVGTGSNRLLVAFFTYFDSNNVSNVSLTWDGVTMTRALQFINNRNVVEIWVLINPNSGNKTLTASWTGSAQGGLGAIEFSGADQTTGFVAADNQTFYQSGSGSASVFVPSATADATVAMAATPYGTIFSSTNQTTIYYDSAAVPSVATYALGGTSNQHGTTGNDQFVIAGIHILAAASGPPAVTQNLNYKLVG